MLEAPGLRGIVLRPGVVYGRGAGVPAMLTTSARDGGAARHVGDGANHWSVVHLDSLAELYVRAVERAPACAAFLAVDGSVRLLDLARAASEGAGAGGRTIGWPLDEARRLAA